MYHAVKGSMMNETLFDTMIIFTNLPKSGRPLVCPTDKNIPSEYLGKCDIQPMQCFQDDIILKTTLAEIKPEMLITLANYERPAQSLINLMISYIGILKVVEPKKYKDEYNKVKNTHKTYKNCVKLLKKPEMLIKLSQELISNIGNINNEQVNKINDIKEKYLSGIDINKKSIVSKYPYANILLRFVSEFICFIEVIIVLL